MLQLMSKSTKETMHDFVYQSLLVVDSFGDVIPPFEPSLGLAYTVFEYCNAVKAILASPEINASNVFTHSYYMESSVLGNMFINPGYELFNNMILESIDSSNRSFKKGFLVSLVLFIVLAFFATIILWVPYYKEQTAKVTSANYW